MLYCKKEIFGTIDGQDVWLFTFSNHDGQYVEITNFGGIIHSWYCFDSDHNLADILLGCQNLNSYTERHPYFGAIIGRYANRIAFGKFTLDNHTYQLSCNLLPHHLHGGFHGLDTKIWAHSLEEKTDEMVLTLTTSSHHLEEGYPGNLDIKVVYTYDSKNEITIEYFAKTDRPTPVNLTNHCYFNLSGDQNSSILDHHIKINASKITTSDALLIPTGTFTDIADTVLDFRVSKILSKDIFKDDPLLLSAKGFDHNFIIENGHFDVPVAQAWHPSSGRRLQVFTDQPAIQLYTGNWLSKVAGKVGSYSDYAGFCLETQHFPDSPNHPHFPDTILHPGHLYRTKTIYKIDTIS